MNKLNQDIQRLNQVATHHTGFLDIEIQEAEDSTRDKSHGQFSKKKRSAHSLKPMDQLKEEIRGDARFKEMYDDIVKNQIQGESAHKRITSPRHSSHNMTTVSKMNKNNSIMA